MASLCACPVAWADNAPSTVQTYIDQAVPVPSPDAGYTNGPLQAGQMTLQDVLKAHPPKAPVSQVPALTSAPTGITSPPVLAPSMNASTQGTMLMQGMQSVLQNAGVPVSTLQPPHLGGGAANLPFAPAIAAGTSPTPDTSSVHYQPGQAPKNLSNSLSPPASLASPAPMAAASATSVSPTVPEASAPVSTTASGSCEPHTETWTRSCLEAGYPEAFTGQIKGETHIVCPGNTMQDVWISNTCAAPEGTESNAPLSAPSPAGPATAVPPFATPSASSPDGNCGPANGLPANAKPAPGDLCVAGEATDVVGDGPWRWSCKGSAGGMTVSCAAPVAAHAPVPLKSVQESASVNGLEDGVCGASNGITEDHAPASGLCLKGDASRVSGDGPWTWACGGRNGGQAAACTAQKKIDGACGNATTFNANEMPATDLCAAGFAGAITGNGPWNWTCSGMYGGTAALCSASPKKDAVCGGATIAGHREAPQTDLCSVGQASNVNGGGPWNWTCSGVNGGAAVSCTAPISVSGVCGSANGVAASAAPSDELCMHGKASRVTGDGPWSWNCSGSDGGDSVSCTAPMVHTPPAPVAAAPVAAPSTPVAPGPASTTASSAAANLYVGCGAASELAPFETPSKDLCSKGHAGLVTGDGPWTWNCSDDSGHSVNCSTLALVGSTSSTANRPETKSSEMPAPMAAPAAPVAAVAEKVSCGPAAGQGMVSAPSEGALCSVGKASIVRGKGPWTWMCARGKEKISCEAAKLQDASCGSANGSVQKSMPATGLCNSGMPTEIEGSGPWMWSCIGSGGGVSVSCSAASQAETRVDGACGAAAARAATDRPSVNLCDSGVASTVYGDGPWTWTCSGLNSGIASSCSAQKTSIAAPPPPGPTVNALCGSANGVAVNTQPEEGLCSTGTATSSSGNGPWNWNCIGENGGMTVSCTAPLQPPAPITGVCGSANGVPTLTTPRSGLCAAGISSAVSGKGPWTWSCSGTNGGGAVGCVAPLAGSSASGLPSLVTPSTEMSPPKRAPQTPVTTTGLVTPQLPAGPLPPLENGNMPQLVPSGSFPAAPEASALPPVPAPGETPEAPMAEPGLPPDTQALQPPPVRDTIKPAPALKAAEMDDQGKLIPGNHFVLPDELSTIGFSTGSENIDPKKTSDLDKLVALLKSTGGVRITLTAYAGVGDNTSPREARRLSLTRALAVRDYLTAKGVSSARIDVRALGANVPSGDPDRVDVKAN